MTPFGACTRNRADVVGAEDAEPAALDHRRPAHADVESSVGDHDVAAAEQRGVAGETPAGGDADERRQAAELGELGEGRHVEAGHAEPFGIARPAAPALGEEDHRQALSLGEFEQPVLLLWLRVPWVPASTV